MVPPISHAHLQNRGRGAEGLMFISRGLWFNPVLEEGALPRMKQARLCFGSIALMVLSICVGCTSSSNEPRVKLGIDVLRDNGFAQLAGKRVGLVTNPSGVDSRLTSTVDLLSRAKQVQL